MGTYAVTHVKKDNKVIAFSDSYDGYLGGGMGQSNIEGIKYFPIDTLKELFDKYTASEKVAVEKLNDADTENENGNRHHLNSRNIENAIYEFGQSFNDEEAKDWLNGRLSSGISTSMVGFAPLLYLDVNTHYQLDYSYCDYMVDLDSELFISKSNGCTISFSKIKSATATQLNAFCNKAKLFSDSINKQVEEFWDTDLTSLPNKEVQAQSEQLLNSYCSVSDQEIDKYYNDIKEAQDKFIRDNYPDKPKFEEEDTNTRSSTVHSANFSMFKLISVITLMQKLKNDFPETAFLLDNSQWGVSEDYVEGGIDIFSPQNKDKVASKIYTDFIRDLQSQLKIHMNVRCSVRAGFDAFESDDDFMDSPSAEDKSMKTLDQIVKMENFEHVVDEVNFYLAIHAEYNEVKPHLLTKRPIAPVLWLYVALINQDKEVFDSIYLAAKEDLSKAGIEHAPGVYIQSLACLNEGKKVEEFIANFGKSLNENYQPVGSDDFIEHLKTTGFFQDASAFMTNAEKAEYGLNGSKTKQKMK